MKKIIFLTSCFLMFSPVFSQEQHTENLISETVEDTISTTLLDAFQQEIDSIAIASENIRTIVDTVDTPDKFTKIFLFSDHTWEYFDLGKPVINDSIINILWDTDKIHPYSDVSLKSLPDEIDILLVDSLHSCCVPFIGKINSKYCFRNRRAHHGTDIKVVVGDSIRAAFDGKVRVVMKSSLTGGYGNLIVIRHANGLETYYGHLSKMFVKENEIVKAGEIIGCGGNTGRSTGAHLHFEIRYQGQSFDPERFFNFETGEFRADTLFTLKKHYFSIYSHYGQTDKQSYAASQRLYHTIKSGDTLGGLAKKYGTTVTRLCKMNNIKSSTVLRIGRKIIVRE